MQPRRPIFLERESYRRRRLGDAAKLLPVLGLLLFLLPVLWAGDGSTGAGLIYLFGAWAVMIVVMKLLSRRLSETEPKSGASSPDDDDVI